MSAWGEGGGQTGHEVRIKPLGDGAVITKNGTMVGIGVFQGGDGRLVEMVKLCRIADHRHLTGPEALRVGGQVVGGDDGEVGKGKEALLGPSVGIARIVKAGVEIHAVVHQPRGRQESRQRKPVGVLHHVHGLTDARPLTQGELPCAQLIQSALRRRAGVHTVRPRQVKEHLEQGQGWVQTLEELYKTNLTECVLINSKRVCLTDFADN